ncbi:MAG: sodium:proton antiporter [Candidatus Aenigmarchaeota archaeon]|nr:sodium:proton antiporter [Candidatus Aenigmarchaeota archaeon]
MSAIVKTVSAFMTVPMMIFGLYVILHGHLTPGGGFPGGAVMATAVAMLIAAFGLSQSDARKKDAFSLFESIGLLAFIAMAFVGLQSTFFANVLAGHGWIFGSSVSYGPNPGYLETGGVIPIMNFAVGIEVFAALSAVMLAIMLHRREKHD